MAFSIEQKNISLRWLIGLSVVNLLVIMWFGLNPEDFSFSNSVQWMTDQAGIRFGKYGIAYTEPFIEATAENISGSAGFSAEIALTPMGWNEGTFNFIFALHNGKDSLQLVLGQWRSWIIVMNGDDYAHRRKINRIALKLEPAIGKKRFITITSAKQSTKVYLDGRLIHEKQDLALIIPHHPKSRLILGNSAYGRHSWRGDIHGLACYRHRLTDRDVRLHFDEWLKKRDFSFAVNDRPMVVYMFDEQGGTRAIDHSGDNHHLHIPSRMQVLKREILVAPWGRLDLDPAGIQDIIMNLVGFMPFGFVLTATWIRSGGRCKRCSVLLTVSMCFGVSLIIEIVQAWLPSRSSELSDLVFNTLGASIGAFSCMFFTGRYLDDSIGIT